LKLNCDEPLSNVAFNFNVRHYIEAAACVPALSHLPLGTRGHDACVIIEVALGRDAMRALRQRGIKAHPSMLLPPVGSATSVTVAVAAVSSSAVLTGRPPSAAKSTPVGQCRLTISKPC